jgi:hypothetical protein
MSLRVAILCAVAAGRLVWGQEEGTAPTPPEELRPLVEIRLAVSAETGDAAWRAWSTLVPAWSISVGKPVRLRAVKNSRQGAALLVRGQVDFAVLEPEDYVRIAESTERGAAVALSDSRGQFGIQVALLVHPDGPHGSETEVMASTASIGLLRLSGMPGRFYRGPLTDEQWQIRAEFLDRLVYGKSADQLVKRLLRPTGASPLGAVLLPVADLPEPDEEGLRGGLREVWLSPLCPGRVIAARAGLGKRERLRVGESLLRAFDGKVLTRAGVASMRLIDDAAFVPLLEFVATPETPDQSR